MTMKTIVALLPILLAVVQARVKPTAGKFTHQLVRWRGVVILRALGLWEVLLSELRGLEDLT